MKRRQILKSAALAATAATVPQWLHSVSAQGITSNSHQPNFLLIMLDDLGYDDLACHGNTIVETPNLDALHAESVTFNNFYVTPVCATTRAALLTGKSFLRTGVSHVHGGKDFIHPDEVLIADYLKHHGYETGMWGKWHSGTTTRYLPADRGFDETYVAQLYKHQDSQGYLNGEAVNHTGWTVDTVTDYAIDFIDRKRDAPWFAYLPYMTIHTPLQAPRDQIDKYLAKGVGDRLASIFAMVDKFDQTLGRLMAALEHTQQAENTVVLFLSDNGPQYFADLPADDLKLRYVNGYKGHKGSVWENGIKSPLFIRYPRAYTPHAVDRLCDVTDLLPTILDLAHVPRSHRPHDLDGRSIVPYLEGDEQHLAPKELILFSHVGWEPEKTAEKQEQLRDTEYLPVGSEAKQNLDFAVQVCGLRTETFKLLQNPDFAHDAPPADDGLVLINMQQDPRESQNVVQRYPATAHRMQMTLKAWFADVIRDEHSYHIPTFELGAGTTNVILTSACEQLSGNAVNRGYYLGNLQHRGDGAVFRIAVRDPGLYQMAVTIAGPQFDPPAAAQFKIGDRIYDYQRIDGDLVSPTPIQLHTSDTIFSLALSQDLEKPIQRMFRIDFTPIT